MKLREKRERRSQPPAAEAPAKVVCRKPPKVKGMLLQTYFASLLSLVVCVMMFLGTSYAWFTSEVNNTENEIYVGTLSVDLELVKGNETFSLRDPNTRVFTNAVKWEPGYTAVETLRVVNKGDLTFNYMLKFISEDAVLDSGVASLFDVYVRKVSAQETVPAAVSIDDIRNDSTGSWKPVGTLDKVLAEESPIFTGEMLTVGKNETTAADGTVTTQWDESGTVTYMISIHMNENATSTISSVTPPADPIAESTPVVPQTIMGKALKLNVKLIAYQHSGEYAETDGFGSSTYDAVNFITSEADLRSAVESAPATGAETAPINVALADDIRLTGIVKIPADKTVILNLNGHKIYGTATEEMRSLIANDGTLTVTGDGEIQMNVDSTVTGEEAVSITDVNAIANYRTLIINGGRIVTTDVDGTLSHSIDNYNGAALTVNDGEIAVPASTGETATFGISRYDGIRLFCGDVPATVVINGGKVASILAANPTENDATPVNGTVVINGGEVNRARFENYTTVKMKADLSVDVVSSGAGVSTSVEEYGYITYSFPNTAEAENPAETPAAPVTP